MGHNLKDCNLVVDEVKTLSEDDLHYSIALKAESAILGKVDLKLGSKGKKFMK